MSTIPTQGRLSRVAPNGRLIDERRVDVSPDRRISVSDDGSIMLDAGPVHGGWDGTMVRVEQNGSVDSIHWRHPKSEDLSFIWEGPGWDLVGRTPFLPRGVAVGDRTGRAVVGGSVRSRWVVISGRDTLQTVSLPDHPVLITTRIRDSVWSNWFAKVPKRLPHVAEVVREDRIPVT